MCNSPTQSFTESHGLVCIESTVRSLGFRVQVAVGVQRSEIPTLDFPKMVHVKPLSGDFKFPIPEARYSFLNMLYWDAVKQLRLSKHDGYV